MLDDRPSTIPEAVYYYTAFKHLSSSRGRGDGYYQPITITDIMSYCNGMKETDIEEFLNIIKPLDEVFMEFYDKKREK